MSVCIIKGLSRVPRLCTKTLIYQITYEFETTFALRKRGKGRGSRGAGYGEAEIEGAKVKWPCVYVVRGTRLYPGIIFQVLPLYGEFPRKAIFEIFKT